MGLGQPSAPPPPALPSREWPLESNLWPAYPSLHLSAGVCVDGSHCLARGPPAPNPASPTHSSGLLQRTIPLSNGTTTLHLHDLNRVQKLHNAPCGSMEGLLLTHIGLDCKVIFLVPLRETGQKVFPMKIRIYEGYRELGKSKT